MRCSPLLGILASCLGALGRRIPAQQPTVPTVPTRAFAATVATSLESIGNGSTVRPLSDGRVLVNDLSNHQLLLLDSTLQHRTVVADTTAATGRAYGRGLRDLVSFTKDSSLVVDELTSAFLVIGPLGKIARVIPAPPDPARANVRPFGVQIDFDQRGHLLFPAGPPFFMALLDQDFVGDTLMVGPDSMAILREDITTRHLDTVAMLKAPRTRQAVTRRGGGLGGSGRSAMNPIPSGDDWTVLSDGTLAIVRVQDYHIDWIGRDGRVTSSRPIPTRWVTLTANAKAAMMDSIRTLYGAIGERGAGAQSGPRQAFVEPSDLPDVLPPFIKGSTRADAEGNVWVRVSQFGLTPGPVVYDVISRDGTVVDRVQLPVASTLVAFGPGVAYLTSRARGMAQLVKMRIR